jgi:hypothetical protein
MSKSKKECDPSSFIHPSSPKKHIPSSILIAILSEEIYFKKEIFI